MELSLKINQEKSQLSQVAQQFGTQVEGNMVRLPKQFGEGFLRGTTLPGGLKVTHYHMHLRQAIKMHSLVPKDAGTFLVTVNLFGEKPQEEGMEGMGKKFPSGCFFYSPGIEAYANSPLNTPFDIITITFPKEFLNHYIGPDAEADGFTKFIRNSPKFCVFEDLDYGLECMLRDTFLGDEAVALGRLEMHKVLLEFMLGLFKKIGRRREGSAALHPVDLQKLFMISGILKSHLHGTPPSIDSLAREAGMSASKLKRGFKQVFGIPPYQYYLKAKMQEAKILLQLREYAISEVGHILGYSNLSKFSQAFKKEFGMTPRQYRGTIAS